ncbi:Thiosulfate sulfurtransferase [Bertholletia excelsa]
MFGALSPPPPNRHFSLPLPRYICSKRYLRPMRTATSLSPSLSPNLSVQTAISATPDRHFRSMDSHASSPTSEVATVDVSAAKELVVSGHRYLDVRTEEEFKKGHVGVENALNIPYMFNTPEGRVKNPKFMEQVMSVCNKDEPLVVGCQSGVRSAYATTDLLNAEFKRVWNMGGGYLAWVEKGLPVMQPNAQGMAF